MRHGLRGCARAARGAASGSRAKRSSRRRAISTGLPDGRRVHQPALVPQAVKPALEAEGLQVVVEALAVVTHLLDDIERPLVVDAEHLADVAARADEALDGGVLSSGLLVDVLRADAH